MFSHLLLVLIPGSPLGLLNKRPYEAGALQDNAGNTVQQPSIKWVPYLKGGIFIPSPFTPEGSEFPISWASREERLILCGEGGLLLIIEVCFSSARLRAGPPVWSLGSLAYVHFWRFLQREIQIFALMFASRLWSHYQNECSSVHHLLFLYHFWPQGYLFVLLNSHVSCFLLLLYIWCRGRTLSMNLLYHLDQSPVIFHSLCIQGRKLFPWLQN